MFIDVFKYNVNISISYVLFYFKNNLLLTGHT